MIADKNLSRFFYKSLLWPWILRSEFMPSKTIVAKRDVPKYAKIYKDITTTKKADNLNVLKL